MARACVLAVEMRFNFFFSPLPHQKKTGVLGAVYLALFLSLFLLFSRESVDYLFLRLSVIFFNVFSNICFSCVFCNMHSVKITRNPEETKSRTLVPLAVVAPCHTGAFQKYSPPSFNERQGQP